MDPKIRQTAGWATLAAVVLVIGLVLRESGVYVGDFLTYIGGLILLVSLVFVGVELTKRTN